MPNLKNCIQKQFATLNINVHKFNYANIALIIIASIISSIALLTDNYQSVIASKIIGLAIIPFISLCIMIIAGSSTDIIQSSTRCLIFMGLCLAVSGIIGFANNMIHWIEEPTHEMLSRAHFKFENIWLELVMSGIAGIGIYYAIIKTSTIALIGLIFAISIIPPLCNAGLFWGMHCFNLINNSSSLEYISNNDIESMNTTDSKYLEYGKNSFVIFVSNITGMFLGFMVAFVISCLM
jgi:hypothetical protein